MSPIQWYLLVHANAIQPVIPVAKTNASTGVYSKVIDLWSNVILSGNPKLTTFSSTSFILKTAQPFLHFWLFMRPVQGCYIIFSYIYILFFPCTSRCWLSVIRQQPVISMCLGWQCDLATKAVVVEPIRHSRQILRCHRLKPAFGCFAFGLNIFLKWCPTQLFWVADGLVVMRELRERKCWFLRALSGQAHKKNIV